MDAAIAPPRMRILLAGCLTDDEPLLLERLHGARCTPELGRAATAEDFDAALAGRSWDAVVGGCTAERFDGLEAFERLRSRELDIPVLLVGDDAAEPRAIRAMHRGVADYFPRRDLNRLAPALLREVRDARNRHESRASTQALRRSEARLREAAAEARAMEQRFRDYAEVASDWLWEMDAHLRFTYLSPAFETATGLPTARVLGRTRWEQGRPTDDPELWAQHRATLEARRPFSDFTHRYVDGQGRWRWVRINGKPLFDDHGAFLGYRGSGQDVTTEMEARAEARAAHERLVDAVECLPAAFLLYDRDERFVMGNSKVYEFFPEVAHTFTPGVSFEERLRYAVRHNLIAVPEGEEERWVQAALRDFRSGDSQREYRRTDGRYIRIVERKTADGGTVSLRFDISDLKAREAALTRSEKRYRDLVEGSIQGVLVHRALRPLFANDAYARMFGYERAEDILALPGIETLHAPAERSRMREYYEARMRGQPVSNRYEYQGLRRDGETIWVDTQVQRIEWEGEPAVLATQVDVTERRHAEEALRRREEHFRAITEQSPDLVNIFDAEGRVQFVSPSVQDILGYSPEEVMGLGATELVHPEDAPFVQAALARVTAETGRSERMEFRLRGRDGRWVLLEARGRNLLHNPAVAGIVVNSRDVTELQRVAAEYNAQRRLLQAVFDSLPVWVAVKDREGRIVLANRAIREATGLDEDALLGRTTAELPYGNAGERAHIMALDDEALASESMVESPEYPVTMADDDRVHYFRSVRNPLRDEAGQCIGLVSVAQDITQHKRLEQQLLQSQRMEAVGRLAGGIAHDFNNMLSIIHSNTGFLLDDLPVGDPMRDDAGEVRKAARRATELTRQLLTFSRRQVQALETLHLGRVVREMEPMLRRLIGEDIGFAVRVGTGPDMVRADLSQVEQIVMNLAVNARDAMPDGGELTIATDTARLAAEDPRRDPDTDPGEYVVLEVADTGTGMDTETRQHIFDPFYSTKPTGQGTGLGLSTVYGIVKQSAGEILVDSEPGRGTTFRVYLPRMDAGEPEAPETTEAAPRGGSETVLLVEDEAGVRRAARRILHHAGYTVLEAGRAAEATELAEAHGGPIDLVVTDVVMPGMNGREVAERLQAVRPGLRVLFMSGYTEDTVVHHGVSERQVPFLQKPFTPEMLLHKVRAALERPGRP